MARHTGRSLLSGLGGAVSIFAILWTSQHFVGSAGAALVVASMGASAVLLFAAPTAPLSQPWNLLAGQTLSAIIGVSAARCVSAEWLGAALAVGGAILVMALLSCTHPPGGATALSAVIGGPAVKELGYAYVLTPVVLNSCVIFMVAVLLRGLAFCLKNKKT